MPASTPRTIEHDQRHLDECYEIVAWTIDQLEGRAPASADAFAESLLEFIREERITKLGTDAPPFFGRIDLEDGETLYVGGQAVRRPDLELLTVSWRAPAAGAFYRATARRRHGTAFRRRYAIADRRVVAHADEDLLHGQQGDLTAAIVEHVRNAQVGAMQDIMTTITPDQHEVISLPRLPPLVVQGGPGTGKTAVGLHRAAWLLYSDSALARANMLVVGPNRRFVDYVRSVLPALGEASVEHLPLDVVGATRARLRLVDEGAIGLLGDARMLDALERALWSSMGRFPDQMECKVFARTVRVTRERLERFRDDARSAVPGYDGAREQFRQLLVKECSEQVSRAVGVPAEDAAQAFRRTPEYQRVMTRVWPPVNATRLLERFCTSGALFDRATSGVFTPAEQRAVRGAVARADRAQRLPSVLSALHDAVRGLLGESPDVEFAHIVVDEAQDLSPLQLRMIARRARHGSVTLLGDFDQRTVATGNDHWVSLVGAAGLGDCDRRTLTVSYRVPSDVLAFARRVLPPGASTPEGVRAADDPIRVIDVGGRPYQEAVGDAVRAAGTVGVVCSARTFPDVARAITGASDGRVTCLPAEECKGLEFNHAVVVDPSGIVSAGERGAGRLYTALTRAISTLTVLHAGDLPAELAGSPHAEYGDRAGGS
jgi:DNA helicase IV